MLWGVLATLLLCIQIVPSQRLVAINDRSIRYQSSFFLIAYPFPQSITLYHTHLSANACCSLINTVLRNKRDVVWFNGYWIYAIASILGAHINYSMGAHARSVSGQASLPVLERIEEKPATTPCH